MLRLSCGLLAVDVCRRGLTDRIVGSPPVTARLTGRLVDMTIGFTRTVREVMSLDKLRELDREASPGPWGCADGGDFEHEGYIEQWIAVVPQSERPLDKYADFEELARVGASVWRYQVRHRKRSEEEDEANARLMALSHFVLLLAEALETVCPMNGRGECFMCGCGSVPDGEGMHADTDNVWGGDRPCFKSEFYADVRAVLAQLEKAVG